MFKNTSSYITVIKLAMQKLDNTKNLLTIQNHIENNKLSTRYWITNFEIDN